MAKRTDTPTTTRRGADTRKEGELPKDRKTAEAGDNRRAGDLDGNRTAGKPGTRKDC
jgi:hypothetical protein